MRSAMADDLVCRRVKECCVRLHSCVQRWNQLNSLGMDVASKLVNILIQSKYTESESSYGVLQGDAELASSLEGKMMVERESLYTELLGIRTKMSEVVQELGGLSSNMTAAVEVILSQGSDPQCPLFNTLPPAVFGTYFADIFRTFSQDLSVKESIVEDLMRQRDRDTLTVYLSCWLHQPYIGPQCMDKMEALLMDTGLRT